MRKPAPVFERWIVHTRHGHTVGHVETSEALGIVFPLSGVGKFRERFEPGQRKSDSGSS